MKLKPRKDPPKNLIAEHFRYDPEIGALYWIKRSSRSKIKVGALAGCIQPDGYWSIIFGGRPHYAHRLVWILHYGSIPEGARVDHINRLKSDNHIDNLRLVTTLGNAQNRTMNRNNTSGIPNVYERWCYMRTFAGRRITKTFRTKKQAVEFALRINAQIERFQSEPEAMPIDFRADI